MAGCFDKEAWIGLLRGEGLPLAGEHLAACPSCRKSFLETAVERGAVDRLLQTLACERDCLDYMELSGCLDGSPAFPEALIAWLHVNRCGFCQEEIASLAAGRRAALSLPKVALAPAQDASWLGRLSGWRESFRWERPVRWAAAAGLLLALGWGWRQLAAVPESRLHVATVNIPDRVNRDHAPEQANSGSASSGGRHQAPQNAAGGHKKDDNRLAAPLTPYARPPGGAKAAPDRPRKVRLQLASPIRSRRSPEPERPLALASLKDGAGRVRLYPGGQVKLSGKAPGLPASLAAMVRQKIKSGSLDRDRPLRVAMASPLPDTLRSRTEAIRLKEPVGTAVLSDRPRLAWEGPEEGILCRVAVYDEDGSPVWEGNATNRAVQVDRPLPGGRLYHWEVSADNGDMILSSAPARFRVLEASRRRQVESLARRYRGWHLARGTLYESEGLYREALAEFRELSRLNPRSAPARRMLEGVEHKAKGTFTKGRM
ncbi:MAG: hypothetical protein IT210_23685 [Armatimonadetes bacterium]|nr:hypothetical protein [Armatimonadota bacterium]